MRKILLIDYLLQTCQNSLTKEKSRKIGTSPTKKKNKKTQDENDR